MFQYAGMKISFTEHALRETEERLFPFSKHRSMRIRKKLIKRYGGEFKKVPCIYTLNGVIIAHPSYKAELNKRIEEQRQDGNQEAVLGNVVPNRWPHR